ncbi:uncharacterized protein LOC112592882 [Melanaphis sacchari]|uniref:uncharacterized protein LOC112592882 n=1 Tax=Melanaphis sacchari TaxID=742174 RepID=UPI000DC13970|nr:uncharacterized protein LOC112592882 [Melanaphis sacchari]
MSIAEEKTQMLKTELLELRENVNVKMSQQLLLRDGMVANYQRMMEECDVYEKELEKIRSENARYKFAEQCLKNKVIEITGCKFAKNSTNSDKDDSVATLQLEVCSNKLLDELKTYRDQAEAVSRQLAGAKDRLAKASETEEYLKRCTANLTVLAEADRTKRDREETELRTMAKRLTAELGDAQRDLDQSRAVVKEMSDVVAGRKPAPVTCSAKGLREDNDRLHAELKANFAVETALHARAAQLETALRHARLDAKSRDRDKQPTSSDVLRDCSFTATSSDFRPDDCQTLQLPTRLMEIIKKYGGLQPPDDESSEPK